MSLDDVNPALGVGGGGGGGGGVSLGKMNRMRIKKTFSDSAVGSKLEVRTHGCFFGSDLCAFNSKRGKKSVNCVGFVQLCRIQTQKISGEL